MGKEWEEAYRAREFVITTANPSGIVTVGFGRICLTVDFRVLDLGCGNGRNSIYAATLGGQIEAVDLVDLGFKEETPEEIGNRIIFYHMPVMDFGIIPNKYTAIIATRLIQYLPESEVDILFARIKDGLTNEGLAMISYTASGGIFDRPDIDVPKFRHTIGEIRQTFRNNGLEIVSLEGKSGVATHVPYANPNETYEILVKREMGA